MDVEKLKKINQLSKDLKRHGLVVEEAITQASNIVNEDEVKTFLDKSKEEIASSRNPTSTDQYIVMLERNHRKIAEEVQNIKNEVARMLSEFEELKNKINSPETRPVQQEEETVQEEKTKEKQEKQAQLSPKKKESHPRQGNFTPEDVSIEKMFYFGKK